MAITKSRTAIWTAQSLTAGAGNTTASWVDLSGSYGATLSIQLTNGATGPTLASQVQIQVADDYNAGSPHLPTNFGGPFIGGVANSEVDSWSVTIPPGIAAIRLVAGSNTGQAVTVDADTSIITAI